MEATTRTFERDADGMIVPASVVTVSKVFCSDSTQDAVHQLIQLIGEDGALRLGEYVESMHGTQAFLLGILAEGWRSTLPLRPVLEVLLLLDGQFTLRALIAQRICTMNPPLAEYLLPFYKATSGVVSMASQ